MSTAGFERGLMLRSPARFQATARRLVELYRAHAEDAAPELRSAVARAWMKTEAYCLNTYWTATRLMEGGTIGSPHVASGASVYYTWQSAQVLRRGRLSAGAPVIRVAQSAHSNLSPPGVLKRLAKVSEMSA